MFAQHQEPMAYGKSMFALAATSGKSKRIGVIKRVGKEALITCKPAIIGSLLTVDYAGPTSARYTSDASDVQVGKEEILSKVAETAEAVRKWGQACRLWMGAHKRRGYLFDASIFPEQLIITLETYAGQDDQNV